MSKGTVYVTIRFSEYCLLKPFLLLGTLAIKTVTVLVEKLSAAVLIRWMYLSQRGEENISILVLCLRLLIGVSISDKRAVFLFVLCDFVVHG